jgi:hypothetical protein
MFKTSRNQLLLFAILAFSLIYRFVLVVRQTFPPGADIGLHNSIIHSITQSGNTNFLYNFFHMGGGSSVTFPGYHVFVSYVILLTGLPDYVSQGLVVCLFSSLTVVAAFLITRRVWNVSAALVAAFLVAISRFDLEMIMWSGYPNVITLLLIPLVFYFFIMKERFSSWSFFAVVSLLSGAIFLTHSLSSVLFLSITFVTVIFGLIFARKLHIQRTSLLSWIPPLFVGAILIFPFLLQVAPAYLGADAATFTGGVAAIRDALLQTKILPLEIVIPLFACIFLYFLFSKYYSGKYLSLPVMLLVFWWLIPGVLTQGYLFGLFTDYQRFLYFVIFPITVLIGIGLYHCARFVGQASAVLTSFIQELPQVRNSNSKTLRRVLPRLKHRNFLIAFMLLFVLYAFLAVPLFASPSQGIAVQSFYQLMNNSEYEAIQWAKTNTPSNSVFMTDAQYGWWFSGFALRPTISAVEPQYLTNIREFEPATAARYLLDTDYLVDNGLIQVREDGGYIGRHNPEILIDLNNTYFPYPFFNLDNSQTELILRIENSVDPVKKINMTAVPVADMHIENGILNNGNEYASIFVTKQNQFFNFTQVTTICQGSRFVNITATLTSNDPSVTFDYLTFYMPTKGTFVQGKESNVIGQVDIYERVIGEILFTDSQPEINDNFGPLRIDYNLNAQSNSKIALSAGLYEYDPTLWKLSQDNPEDELTAHYTQLLEDYAKNYTIPISDKPLEVFDYRQAISDHTVSYVVLRNFEHLPRFAGDPMFSLVFINDGVAIFQVRKGA